MEKIISYPKGYKSANIRLKLARNLIGATQKDFAIMVDVKPHNIKDIEIGKTQLQVELAFKVEEIYDVNARWLLVGEGDIFLNKIDRIEIELFILEEILEAINSIKFNPKTRNLDVNLSQSEITKIILYLFKQEISHENLCKTIDDVKELKYEISRRLFDSLIELLKLMEKI